MFKKSNGKPSPIMTRKEVAVWVGRALSSSEVAMRMLLQAVDVITLQQQVIEALHEKITMDTQSPEANEAFREMEQGLSKRLQGTLGEIHDQIQPIIKSIDEACKTLEGML
jgi:FtsZ-binding cell division protein ZapB